MNNLKILLKIFDYRYDILQERRRIGDINDSIYGFQLIKLDNELKDLLDVICNNDFNIKEDNK